MCTDAAPRDVSPCFCIIFTLTIADKDKSARETGGFMSPNASHMALQAIALKGIQKKKLHQVKKVISLRPYVLDTAPVALPHIQINLEAGFTMTILKFKSGFS